MKVILALLTLFTLSSFNASPEDPRNGVCLKGLKHASEKAR